MISPDDGTDEERTHQNSSSLKEEALGLISMELAKLVFKMAGRLWRKLRSAGSSFKRS